MSNFKVGDKVVRVAGFKTPTWCEFKNRCGCKDDDTVTVTGVTHGGGININNFRSVEGGHPFAASFFQLVESVGSSKPSVAAWDFSEAQRLHDAAKVAVEAYNEYVASKPEDTYLTVYNPFQS